MKRRSFILGAAAGAVALYFGMLLAGLVFEVLHDQGPRQGITAGDPTDPMEWHTWPRKGTVPQATDDCATDDCLETRERILTAILKGGKP